MTSPVHLDHRPELTVVYMIENDSEDTVESSIHILGHDVTG